MKDYLIETVSSWGRLSTEKHRVVKLFDRMRLPMVVSNSVLPGIPHGNGRSYGDVCLNSGGTIWSTKGLDKFISFDPTLGIVQCESGVLLKEVIELALPHGWFPYVVPGTQYVTVGGAIANDIHGKSHHVSGTFGDHVIDFELLRTDGSLSLCSRELNRELFAATVGGLGLTGIITQARFQLRRVEGAWLDTQVIPYDSLEQFFELSAQCQTSFDYAVSWIDCYSGEFGQGLFFQANHVGCRDSIANRKPRRFPFTPPVSFVTPLTVKTFNRCYRAIHLVKRRRRLQHYSPFFFPLDGLLNWNRLYGRSGFYQYQSVVPSGVAVDATREMLHEISAARSGSFLAVLKVFGDRPSPGMLSFPMSGVTLALDFPNKGEHTVRLFDRLNSIVLNAGGRLYWAKDACMPSELVRAGYPNVEEFLKYRDPGISSSMSRRIFGY